MAQRERVAMQITEKFVLWSEELRRPGQGVGIHGIPVLLAIFHHQALQLASLHMERVAPISPCPDENLPGVGVVDIAEPGADHAPHWVLG